MAWKEAWNTKGKDSMEGKFRGELINVVVIDTKGRMRGERAIRVARCATAAQGQVRSLVTRDLLVPLIISLHTMKR